MILRGILDNCLNGQLCVRGFAPIKELARISKADYSYQRDPIDRKDILDFLEKQTYLFFPEIILSYKIPHVLNGDEEPLKSIQEGKTYTSKYDKTKLLVKKSPFKDSQDISGKNEIKILSIEIQDDVIANQPFHRIDGNHRLKAAEHSENPKVSTMIAPFCLILGTEYYKNNQIIPNENSKDFDKSIKVFFHNINTKTIPLTSEENLKVLIDDPENFPNKDLKNIFNGIYPIKTRELIKKANPDIFNGIGHILKRQYRSYYNEIFSHLLNVVENKESVVDKVLVALQAINILYEDTPKFKANDSFGILAALLYYKIKENGTKFEMFKSWLLNNNIFEIKEVTADSLIKIFDKISSTELKVFVAMPYFKNEKTGQGDSDIINEYNAVYEKVISELRRKYNINISMYPIMNNKGETQDQIQDIINKIKKCTFFFADITNNNPNVTYEMGWARALNKKVIIVKEEASEPPKSDYKNDTYHPYKAKALQSTLGDVIEKNIEEELKKGFGLISEDKK
ncbi:MAG: hypothetical protein J6T62_04575 [Fibrobacter sp.]|nr:hypothetical protein [Fibrobacter sp.]